MAECVSDAPAKAKTETLMQPKFEDKKYQMNGHSSPVRQAAYSANPTGKQILDGFLKTDDRMRLAKERREEREKSLAARDLQILEKEKRAKLQYERQMEERWRKLEEQRQKEELRRAAVEEKRRQRLEEEKERLEAMIRRSMERSQQLEQRPKRWSWGGALSAGSGSREGDPENTPPPLDLATSTLPSDPETSAAAAAAAEPGNAPDKLSASTTNLPKHLEPPINKRLSSSSATITHPADRAHRLHLSPLENLLVSRLLMPTHSSLARCRSTSALSDPCQEHSAPSSPLKSPYKASPSRGSQPKKTPTTPSGSSEESAGVLTIEVPKTEKLKKEKRTSSPVIGSPLRRPESPSTLSKRSSSPATPRSLTKTRAQSPTTVRQYPSSPMKQRAIISTKTESLKKSDKEKSETVAQQGETEEKVNGTKEDKKISKSESSENTNSAEPSPVTPTGKTIAGTTDAEEASKLLAERRRQARLQKEREEQEKRQQEEAERIKAEELRRKMEEERLQQEDAARRAEEEKRRLEEEKQQKELEELLMREAQERELQAQMEKEKEEAEQKAYEEAERLRQEREQLMLQVEQERLQRKKRIEEIMKRTRKSDISEIKKEEVKEQGLTAENILKPIETNARQDQDNGKVEKKVLEEYITDGSCSEVNFKDVKPTEPLNINSTEMKPAPVDDSADEVQSMDVSPVSKEELISIPEYSPVNEIHQNGMSNSKALEDLLDLTGHIATYPKTTSATMGLGDCNKNLIDGFCGSGQETQLIESITQAVEKVNIQ
ncbi:MAP7 domain-containing protein 2-like isoform X2 [Erpetoichthys calabaricus]|uniref:MAP7 domain-containing protein 2-like isoform X2 n=1 Tax=Erpetoichthys calabaricus TaxID=27687 RepID=UPI00223477CF|nr:MAP7 domain-containing protein 2-like isoform X2 [Erpetoichthys calabaricus]